MNYTESFFDKKHLGENASIILFSGAISVLLVCIAMFLNSVYPFGDNSILEWDALLQHKDYYSYVWDILNGNVSLNYSFSKSLGGRMIGILAFYVSSPSNILLIFIDKSQVPEYLSWMLLLKTFSIGASMCLFLKIRYSITDFWVSVLSVSYALMEYNVVYCRNLMWLDGVFFLPLVGIGVYCCIKDKYPVFLSIIIGLAIISNWYTGYMLCLMSTIYFLYELIFVDEVMFFREKYRTAFRYVFYLLIGVGISAIILLPSCLSLLGGKASFSLFSGITNMSLLHFFTGFAINSAYNKQTAPILYCGGILLILVIYSFFDREVPKKIKIGNGMLLIIMIASYLTRDMELLWTAFVRSTSYYYRFAFVFPFSCVIIVAGLLKNMSIRKYYFEKVTAFKVIITIVLFTGGLYLFQEIHQANYIVAYVFILFIYLWLLINSNHINFNKTILLLILSFELVINASLAYKSFNNKISDYQSYFKNTSNILSVIRPKSDEDFYRIEKNFSYISRSRKNRVATGESFIFNYSSIEHYTSAYDRKVDRFLNNVGYSDFPQKDLFPCEQYWNSPQPVMETLLGIKYVFYDHQIPYYKKINLNNHLLPKGWNCYENLRRLPLAYSINPTFRDIVFCEDPFKNQNTIVNEIVGKNINIFNNVKSQRISFSDSDEIYKVVVEETGPFFMFVDGMSVHNNFYADNCELYINNAFIQKLCRRFTINTISIGEFRKGDIIHIKIKHLNKKIKRIPHKLYFYYLDKTKYEYMYQHLKQGIPQKIKVDKDTVQVLTSYNENKKMILTIPFDEGWCCKIDGIVANISQFANALCVVDVPKGRHIITFEYSTPGLFLGVIISLLSIGCCFIESFWPLKYIHKSITVTL